MRNQRTCIGFNYIRRIRHLFQLLRQNLGRHKDDREVGTIVTR
jgi:hypothetical protein